MICLRSSSMTTAHHTFWSKSIAGKCPFAGTARAARNSWEGSGDCGRSTCTSSATYYHGWRQRRHVEQFGIEQLRVLTVTTSEKRIDTMLDALRDVTNGKGSELFLFIDEDRLHSGNPLEVEWITGKGNRARLTD